MATAQVTRPKQSTKTWSSVFPAQQNTMQESEVFVKKLLAVGLSSITYLRTIFPENSYHEQYLDGMKLKVLIDNSNCRSSNMVVSWMRSCFEAIEKKYLRQLTFAISNKDNHLEAYETYTYKFRYTGDGPVMSGPGTPDMTIQAKDTRHATERMLRTILLLTQSLRPLPKGICLSMKLGYYDEVTPKDYEPPSFSAIEEESYSFRSKPVTIRVGNVSTRFHGVKLYVCTEETAYLAGENSPSEVKDGYESHEEQKETSEDCGTVVRSYNRLAVPLRSSVVSTGGGSQDVPITQSQADDQLVPTQTQISNVAQSSNSVIGLSTLEDEERPQSSTQNSENFPVRCPCGVPYDQGLMILCDICQKWQHGACFNVLEDSEVRGSHVCEECASSTQPCTDPTLPQQPEMATFCLFRRALVLLEQIKSRVTAASLAQQLGVDITVGSLLFKRLQGDKLVYTKRRMNYVNRTKLLGEAFPKYLKGHSNLPESQQTVDICSQTPQCSKPAATFDSDATPDLECTLQGSITTQESRCRAESPNNSLDETVDILSLTQDVTVGTQGIKLSSKPSLEASEDDTPSEALATAGNTLLLLDSPPGSQKTQKCFTSVPLHSGMDVEEGSAELLQNKESSKDPRPQEGRLSLGKGPKRRRGRPKRSLSQSVVSDNLEVSVSQDSDIFMENSISQDSEVSKKKKKTHH